LECWCLIARIIDRAVISSKSSRSSNNDDIGGRNVVRLAFSIIAESQNLADVMREDD
jgi:hypothetical protein